MDASQIAGNCIISSLPGGQGTSQSRIGFSTRDEGLTLQMASTDPSVLEVLEVDGATFIIKRAQVGNVMLNITIKSGDQPISALSYYLDVGDPDIVTDSGALEVFYNATDGPNWTDNTNWLTDAPLSEWFGVYTDDSGRVAVLFLARNGLNGQVPSALANMDRLFALDFYDNPALTGPLPQSLTRLPLSVFSIQNTNVCVPGDDVFQAWIASIEDFAGNGKMCESGTIGFTDHPISPGATAIRAVHFRELRERIASLRAREGLPRVQWTDPVLTAGETRIRWFHLTELRSALDAVYDVMRRPRPVYTDTAVTAGVSLIKAVHVMELRSAIVALETRNARAG